MGTGSFPGVKCGLGVLLTTHLLVLRSWKSRAIPLPTLWATPGLNGITLPLPIIIIIIISSSSSSSSSSGGGGGGGGGGLRYAAQCVLCFVLKIIAPKTEMQFMNT